MKIDWSPIRTELVHWRRAQLHLPIWWRDDDAVAATPALERLLDLAADTGVPIHIAVIPEPLTSSLAPLFAQNSGLIPIVHGWRHVSHAPDGQKNAEFGHVRAEAAEELGLALDKLDTAFGPQLIKLFVPPWNRIAPDMLPALASNGYSGLSTYGPRKSVSATKGVTQINTHIDPISWRGDRGLVDPDVLITRLVTTLQDRRAGRTDAQEPLGLLTHHLVHTEDVWTFSQAVMHEMLHGGAQPADLRVIL